MTQRQAPSAPKVYGKKTACLVIAACLLTGCAVTTKRFAPEYSRNYVLAADTPVWNNCHLWTGWYSLNIGGYDEVNCLVSEYYGKSGDIPEEVKTRHAQHTVVFKKGSQVRIKRIFTIVHQGNSTAELLITDPDTGRSTAVYGEYWPANNPNLLQSQ